MFKADVGASFLVYYLFMLSALNLLNRFIKHGLNLIKLLSGKLLLVHEWSKVFLRWVSVGKEDILWELDVVSVRCIIIFGWISIVNRVQGCNHDLLSLNQFIIIILILLLNRGHALRVTLVESRCFLMLYWLSGRRHLFSVKTRLYMQILHVNCELRRWFREIFTIWDLLFVCFIFLLRAVWLTFIFRVKRVVFFFRIWRIYLIDFSCEA